ncbi:MAG: energy-coupled thiamine transporter ThiT [Erysipelotrichaceae bacterium]|nr:energy-coupled thiamine transporter ThiT [Erysipelotrichaceae bacterium]
MNKTKRLVSISIYVALALVLDYIKAFIPFLNMPSGGSINIALIPIVVCSFHLGVKDGIIAGFLWWLTSSVLGLNNWIINVYQYIVDYIIPSVLPGCCSFLYKNKKLIEMELGIFICMSIRCLALIVSGAIFWPGEAASNSIAAWVSSTVYNFPYSVITMIMLMVVSPLISKSFRKMI